MTCLSSQVSASPPYDLHPEVKNLPDESRSQLKWSTFIGRDVENTQGDGLGKVTDLALDMRNGRIAAVIVTESGFLGMGPKRSVGVPPGAFTNFRQGREDGTLFLDASKQKFAAAPELEMSHWAEYFQRDHLAKVVRYFGVEPYFGGTGMSLGPVETTRQILGLEVRDGPVSMGKVVAIRVDSKSERVMLVLVVDNSGAYSKCEITASQVQLNAARNALSFTLANDAGSSFRRPGRGSASLPPSTVSEISVP